MCSKAEKRFLRPLYEYRWWCQLGRSSGPPEGHVRYLGLVLPFLYLFHIFCCRSGIQSLGGEESSASTVKARNPARTDRVSQGRDLPFAACKLFKSHCWFANIIFVLLLALPRVRASKQDVSFFCFFSFRASRLPSLTLNQTAILAQVY